MLDATCKIEVFADSSAERNVRLTSGSRRLESKIQREPLTKLAIERLDRMVHRQPDDCEQEDLRLLGELLFGVLFDGTATEISKDADGSDNRRELTRKLGYYFLQYLEEFELELLDDPGRRLRIDLFFHVDVADLSRYPWEFLYVNRQEKSFFLAGQNTHLILTRSLTLIPKVNPLPERLLVWVAWAQPIPLDRLPGIEAMAAEIEGKLGGALYVAMKEFKDVTLDDFENAINAVIDKGEPPPDIIHFIGHGQIENGKNQLAFKLTRSQVTELQNAAVTSGVTPESVGECNWVNAETISGVIARAPPRLFFLHSCNTGRVGPGVPSLPGVEAFRGAAQRIADSGVSFVIAMQYAIENEDAKQFTRTFYDGIGKGKTIDDAVTSGRDVLGQRGARPWNHRRFGAPVVFMRTLSQSLMRPHITPHSKQTTDRLDCPYCSKLVRRDEVRCRCEMKKGYQFCGNGHACMTDDTICPKVGCGLPLRPTPTAAPPPISEPGGVVAGRIPAASQTKDLGSA